MRTPNFILAAIVALVVTVTITSAQTQNFNELHQFTGGTDGAFPEGAVVRDAAGNLYGTTTLASGGVVGTVYKIDSTGTETILLRFNVTNGSGPASPLILDEAGTLYGIANSGPAGGGVIYKLLPTGEQTLLHSFAGGANLKPKTPSGGILRDKLGNILGSTEFGGSSNCPLGCGTIFRLNSAGKLALLHKFIGTDGSQPFGPFVQDTAGNLYGVAQFGGDLACPDPQVAGQGCGTVFKLSKKRVLTVLHTFEGGTDGATPQAGLFLDVAGNVFGATMRGGTSEKGTLFKISSNGTYTVLHRFAGSHEGMTPNGGLVIDEAGNLFGTAQAGGDQGFGTLFRLTPTGVLSVVHTFTGQDDGAFPLAGLIRDDTGHFFGTAFRNFLPQTVQGGNVFEVRP